MIVRLCAFTERGRALAERAAALLADDIVERRPDGVPLADWIEEAFELRAPIVFIGACGIAVRAIAPFVKDKFLDPPVVAIDELGRFAIPILSGHLGGANELAQKLAQGLGAQNVVTTATDVNGLFAVDVFAKKNGLRIVDRRGARTVASIVLSGRKITFCVEPDSNVLLTNVPDAVRIADYPPNAPVDVLIAKRRSADPDAALTLVPKSYVFGVGCKKGVDAETIERVVGDALGTLGAPFFYDDALAVATIDVKRKERGLVEFAQRRGIPLKTYSAQELNAVEGDFSVSEFVNEKVGVPNVCERAAVLAAGKDSVLIVKKTCREGVALAVAQVCGKREISSWTS